MKFTTLITEKQSLIEQINNIAREGSASASIFAKVSECRIDFDCKINGLDFTDGSDGCYMNYVRPVKLNNGHVETSFYSRSLYKAKPFSDANTLANIIKSSALTLVNKRGGGDRCLVVGLLKERAGYFPSVMLVEISTDTGEPFDSWKSILQFDGALPLIDRSSIKHTDGYTYTLVFNLDEIPNLLWKHFKYETYTANVVKWFGIRLKELNAVNEVLMNIRTAQAKVIPPNEQVFHSNIETLVGYSDEDCKLAIELLNQHRTAALKPKAKKSTKTKTK